MKTTRKGFTLIELIVVIAIIGVLAAILVPAMLGWVKKSKIQAANADAKTIMTNINAGLEEMDEEGLDPLTDGWYTQNGLTASDWATAVQYASYYGDTIVSGKYAIWIKGGVAVACVSKSGKYYGTYPAALTNKNYDSKMGSNKNLSAAKVVAESAYNANHSS
ncbi:MAG: prepilin-type N-terminal cleavage/methylation domain-containing protein [Ruminococcus sp.]|nr:prepilin-type N-terminal cleavage/methylation domain-containing protein [Ruminococcus sp.]